MKVTVNQPLYEINGEEIKSEEGSVLLKDLLMRAALADLDKEEKSKLDDFNLFLKIKTEGNEIEFTNSELSRLQEKVKKSYATLLYGQINFILEGKDNPLKLVKDAKK